MTASVATQTPNVSRLKPILRPDRTRVLVRPFFPSSEGQALRLLDRLLSMTEAGVERELATVLTDYETRHMTLRAFLLRRVEDIGYLLPEAHRLSQARRYLIGACFTLEYSVESAALFNPSIVLHPDQTGLDNGSRRFILSLRATGEGHISSVAFRGGIVNADGAIALDPMERYVTEPHPIPNPAYDKACFLKKLREVGLADEFAERVLHPLGDVFSREELDAALGRTSKEVRRPIEGIPPTVRGIELLADSNYEVQFDPDTPLSQRVIFPASASQRNGIEDARFVSFQDDDGSRIYYATYTAFDGKLILPQLLETRDFLHFRFITLNGPAVQNKGLALFPRKIDGLYAMLSRQDNENVQLMFSDHLHFWYTSMPILKPRFPWEFVQVGNCGSPIETPEGWLVLSHGVGPMRRYCIGAFLLDLRDPTRVIGRLREPLISPDAHEREGYVPNVVYTCGMLPHHDRLLIPYGIADTSTAFASVPIADVLSAMVSPG